MQQSRIFDSIMMYFRRNEFIRTILYPVRKTRTFIRSIPLGWQNKIITHLSDLLIEDVILRVEEFGGIFSLSGRSDIFRRLIIYKSFESDLVKVVKRLVDPNRDAIDVGANIGFYSILFNTLINDDRKVLAIEPSSNALSRLKKNLILNKVVKNVIIFEGGVSDSPGVLKIKTILDKEEYSTLGAIFNPAVSMQKFEIEDVQISTIDILVNKYSLNPGLIKIDVEGMEPSVFRGMENVLRNNRPIVLAEWDDLMLKSNGFEPSEVIRWLELLDYQMFDPIAPNYPPKWNMLCLPKERSKDIRVNY